MVEDIKDAWPIFIFAIFASIIICFLFYYLLENCTLCMIFLMLAGSLAAMIGFGFYQWKNYEDL